MAKGSIAKQEIIDKILAAFPGSFAYNDGKEIRINTTEDGTPVQIKVTLTAAKVAVEPDGENAIPGAAVARAQSTEWNFDEPKPEPAKELPPPEPTEDDKETVATLLASLGF